MQQYKLPKSSKVYLEMINQIFEIEKKVDKLSERNSISRNISRLQDILENLQDGVGFIYHNPIDEPYDETRLDCDANIAGESAENLVITEVIKPIIRYKQGGHTRIVQKAVVIVQSKN